MLGSTVYITRNGCCAAAVLDATDDLREKDLDLPSKPFPGLDIYKVPWSSYMAIPFPPGVAVLVVVLTLHAVGSAAQAQTAVTLWQFGPGRLLSAQLTLPLEPLATATDGSATVYLYQAVNNAELTTTNAGGVTTTTFASATPRTIIASASGWFEPNANGGGIECALENASFGRCFNIQSGGVAVPANSGKPFAEVLGISTSSSTSLTPTVPLPSSSSSDTNANLKHHSTPVGAIVGAVIALLLVVLGGLSAFVLLRRRRKRRVWDDEQNAARAYDAGVVGSESVGGSAGIAESLAGNGAVFASPPQVELRRPQAELGRGRRRKGEERFRVAAPPMSELTSPSSDASGSGPGVGSVQVASELQTADLVRLLAERIRSEERAPPYALVERGDV
ncbi:hypothetical protein C8R46DRAFT_94226 [Mycena filopes]|nr:hypothetical protein C8R46DRAFT_94226 [Mycena filopes]